MGFLHCDRDETLFTLHDCITERVCFADNVLSFDFSDGFWVLPDHPDGIADKAVRTDASRVEYTLIDNEYDVTIYVFEKSLFGQIVRKEWSIEDLVRSRTGVEPNCPRAMHFRIFQRAFTRKIGILLRKIPPKSIKNAFALGCEQF